MRKIATACIVSAALGAMVHRCAAFLAGYGPPMQTAGPYSVTLVDRIGGPLSRRPGEIKLAIDPWAVYRNLPEQTLPYLSVDGRGYRHTLGATHGRPVVILGGSAAFGQGLQSDADTVASRLSARGQHVVNAAVVGYLSGQELAEMVHYSDRLKPEAYVAVDGWNDLHSQSSGSEAYGYGYNWDMLGQIEARVRKSVGGDHGALPRECPPLEALVRAYLDNLERMHAFARARDARLLIVFQPLLTEAMDGGRFAEFRGTFYRARPRFDLEYGDFIARAAGECRRRGWDCLDLSAALRDPGLFADPVHPNAAGHERMAELIAPRLGAMLEGGR